VEDHPLDGHLGLEHLAQMPRDRLAFAVFVGRQQELVGLGELLLQVGDDPLLVRVDDVERLEPVLDVDAELSVPRSLLLRDVGGTVRQVADVAHARLDDEVAAEVAGDRARLGRGFDDDEAGHGRDSVTVDRRAAPPATERILRRDGAPAETELAVFPRCSAELAGLALALPAALEGT
jgi:hypothetical protein